MSAGRSTWLALAALLGAGCGAERDGGALDIGSGDGGSRDVDTRDATETTAPPDASKDTTVDARGDTGVDDPYCHHDCMGGFFCKDGVVRSLAGTPVPCQYWQGACPLDTSFEPVVCPYGCRRTHYAGEPFDANDPASRCQPCEDPKKTGPECDRCANPFFTGPDCATCIDPETHGPACNQCGTPRGGGCPCTQNSDCMLDFCLRGEDGPRCAMGCESDAGCPAGFACTRKGDGYPRVCTPRNGYLCEVCSTDDDCDVPGEWNVICADIGLPETRCTRICADRPCPDGYRCERITLDDGPADVCVPDAGSCE